MPEVRRTADFERVAALPRRTVTYDDAVAWAGVFTEEFALAKGAALTPWQGAGLAEAAENDGLFAALPVGFGKTILSRLLPRAMRSRRAVLLIPASLEDKTRHDFAALVGKWRGGDPPTLLTLQSLSRPAQGEKLFELDPDLIMVDESDELQNRSSSVCRRIDRYVVAKQGGVRVCVFTGTPSRKSIMNYWHHLCWCLRDGAPVPMSETEAVEWGLALDDFGMRTWTQRMGCGPLGGGVTAARRWFARRLSETPGVLIVDGDSAGDVPLHVALEPAKEDPAIDGHYKRFLELGENPAGIPVTDPLSRWRTDGQLGTGLYLRYKQPPPPEWRNALRSFASFCREAIEDSTHARRPLDTEAQVVRAHPDAEPVVTWLETRPTFTPETEAVRLSPSAVESALAWLARESTPAVIWCGSVEIGMWISQVGRFPYYGREGRDAASGRALFNADPRRSLVASWHANKRGFNLQAWRRALLVHPPQSAKYLEQIIGRHHRQGQTEAVRVTVLCTSGGTYDAFDSAVSEATFAKSTVSLTQKILRAEITCIDPPPSASNQYRWARKER
jgi:hypothetical protein